jgi:hypothetical protein
LETRLGRFPNSSHGVEALVPFAIKYINDDFSAFYDSESLPTICSLGPKLSCLFKQNPTPFWEGAARSVERADQGT